MQQYYSYINIIVSSKAQAHAHLIQIHQENNKFSMYHSDNPHSVKSLILILICITCISAQIIKYLWPLWNESKSNPFIRVQGAFRLSRQVHF